MRILQITSHLNVGGVTSHLLSLSHALAARGHQLIVASGGGQLENGAGAGGLTHWRVPLHTSVEFSPQVVSAGRQLAARLAQRPVDLLHAHTRVAQVVAERLSRAAGLPYVTTWHGFFRRNLGRRWWPCTGELTIAISEPVRQHLLRDFHLPAERIRLIPHGIDPAPFETPVDSSAAQRLRERARVATAGPLIGTVARLVASKGVDQLIRALPQVRASAPEAQLLVVGDGAMRPHLERLAASLGVAEAVHFAGALPQTRTALSLMDVFVFLPAEQEGFGLSLLEAMASGRPIVAVRRGGGATWVLQESGAGMMAEPGDPAGLAAAITRILQDGQLARQLGEQARAVVKARYALERMVDAVESVYNEVMRD
ncbi:MAG: glycosyltransferase family 4 protein [Candidatus Omnitrophota bacterium]|nr:glycosyltransferase family 4 protein [Candidatus Omnitrophota bacterium]